MGKASRRKRQQRVAREDTVARAESQYPALRELQRVQNNDRVRGRLDATPGKADAKFEMTALSFCAIIHP